VKREKPISLLGFSGQEEKSFGKYIAPLLDLKVENHVSQISCDRPFGKRDKHNYPRGWFMVEHPMPFEGNGIQVQQHICNPESIISYNESVLDEDTVWIGSIIATKAPNSKEIKELVL
jgi:hypothetical protein